MSDLLVLCYHAVSERWPASLSVTPGELTNQLRFLVRRGYRGATFTNAVTEPADGRRLVVTFDDAYRSVLTRALPILERFSVPATVFAPTAFVGREKPVAWPGVDVWLGTEYEHELVPASWEELADLAARGWEIGSHTSTHPRLPDLDDAALAAELSGAKAACERNLGLTCRSVAYPYGAVDDRVVAAAADAGYVAGADLPQRFSYPTPLRWPRVGVFHRDAMPRFRLKTSIAVRRARASFLWTAVERLRARS